MPVQSLRDAAYVADCLWPGAAWRLPCRRPPWSDGSRAQPVRSVLCPRSAPVRAGPGQTARRCRHRWRGGAGGASALRRLWPRRRRRSPAVPGPVAAPRRSGPQSGAAVARGRLAGLDGADGLARGSTRAAAGSRADSSGRSVNRSTWAATAAGTGPKRASNTAMMSSRWPCNSPCNRPCNSPCSRPCTRPAAGARRLVRTGEREARWRSR